MINEFRSLNDIPRTGAESVEFTALHRQAVSAMSASDASVSQVCASAAPCHAEVLAEAPELRAALNGASSVRVLPAADASDADLVIKRDGSIEQFIKLNRSVVDQGELIIAMETDIPGMKNLTISQIKTLQDLSDYLDRIQKELCIDSITEIEGEPIDALPGGSKRHARDASQHNPAPIEPGRTSPSGINGMDNAATTRALNRSSDQAESFSAGTGRDTTLRQTAQRDWSDVDLFQLLLDWFSSDEETFKKLMPGLYKKIAGANGKIDLKRLRKIVDSKDPILKPLRNEFPRIAEAFSSATKSGGDQVSASCDAVNPTGAVLAVKAAQVSNELGTSGYCAKGVSYAIERATGKVIWGNANDMRNSLPEQGFSVAQSKDLKVGQVVHVYWTPEVYAQEQARRGPCPNYGDIAVIGKGHDGKLYAYNDAATPLDDYLQKSRYDWSTLKVFNPPNV
jgi:hypothetical protein